MGRTKQIGTDQSVGLFNIFEVFKIAGFQSLEMMVGMVSYSVTLFLDLLEDFRIAKYIFPDCKKCCLNFLFAEQIENPWCHTGYRAIIESEVYGFVLPGHAPDGSRKPLGKKPGQMYL
jgi:hypothetical protein